MIDYQDDGLLLPMIFRYRGAVAYKACKHAIPSTLLTVFFLFLDKIDPDFQRDIKYYDLGRSQIWSMTTTILIFVIGFRCKAAMSRFWEGCGLLHRMKGEWFEACSNCVAFSSNTMRSRPKQVEQFRHTLIRLMSLCHACALEEISDMSAVYLESLDVYGLSRKTLKYLKACEEVHHFNKVEVLVHLLQTLITRYHANGVLDVPAPILSRAYQNISRGFVHFLDTKKITEVKFPFPYCQLIALLMALHMVLVPAMVTATLDSKVLAPIVSFLVVFGISAVNMISQELEMPFGLDANDLPISSFQEDMSNSLLMLLHPTSDLIAGVSSNAKMDFSELAGTAKHQHMSCKEARFAAERLASRRPSMVKSLALTKAFGDQDHDAEAEYDWESEMSCSSPTHSPQHIRADAFASDLSSSRDASKQSVGSCFPGVKHDAAHAQTPAHLSQSSLLVVPAKSALADKKFHSQYMDAEGQLAPFTPREEDDPNVWDAEFRVDKDEATPGLLSAPRLLPFDFKSRSLKKRMDELNDALQLWTQTIEKEVSHLSSHLVLNTERIQRHTPNLGHQSPRDRALHLSAARGATASVRHSP